MGCTVCRSPQLDADVAECIEILLFSEAWFRPCSECGSQYGISQSYLHVESLLRAWRSYDAGLPRCCELFFPCRARAAQGEVWRWWRRAM
jgi:hypothetical protein